MDLLLHIWLFYGVITVLLMLFLIVIFGKNKRFNNSFYRIAQCNLVLNLFCYFNSWIHRLAQRPSTGNLLQNIPRQILVITSYTMPFALQSQSLSIVLLCFYRYSLLLKIWNFSRFWAKWYILVYFGLILSSIAIILPISFTFFPLTYDESVGYYISDPYYLQNYRYNFGRYLWYCCMIYLLVITTLGLLTLYKLRKRFAHHHSSNDPRTRDMMKRVTLIVTINSLLTLIL
ncbi:unnamed protein product [Caenorhabditis angaria]|uniref:Serpentine receptor class gamma n=1 Tax=Caenorhabditis angaria TaxID=860376 RepID=A0A9P1IT46_9PELO|nr:unnamed protein product [Caenorhabditis angaria]